MTVTSVEGVDGMKPPDLVTAEPKQAKVLLENERVRVLDVRVPAGQKQAMHSHPDHLVYSLSAYRVKHIAADGRTSLGERQPGEVVWIPSESHAGENIGDTEIHALIVELKEAR
jgi:quercetin dioxygenase-like cupin family protein